MCASYLILYSPAKSSGVRIPYPTITVHAQEGNAIFLGLNLSDANTADEDLVFIQLRIILTQISLHTEDSKATAEAHGPNGHAAPSPSQALFKAISDCQELNPDPPEEGEEEIEDETAPGATGWITSENMADFLDENGELKMPEGITVIGAEDDAHAEAGALGAGAGRTRTAAEVEDGDAEDETKWQRTG
jgi:chloride channel, nucleotide-sensitive, 1A